MPDVCCAIMSRRSRRLKRRSTSGNPPSPPRSTPQTVLQAILDLVSKLPLPARIAIVSLIALAAATAAVFSILPERAKETAVSMILPATASSPPTTAGPLVQQPTNHQTSLTPATLTPMTTASSPASNADGAQAPLVAAESAAPGIEVLEYPSRGGGTIAGKVAGLPHPDRYGIIIYAHTDKWYVQPDADHATVRVQENGSWRSWTRRGSEFLVLLVPRGFRPEAASDAPPIAGDDVVTFQIVAASDRGVQ
jgi:hypothetical protein